MDKHIKNIFEKQELENKMKLEDNYINVIQREFKNAKTILSMSCSERSLYAGLPFALNQVLVRSTTEFSIRKHTSSIIPYYHSHVFLK